MEMGSLATLVLLPVPKSSKNTPPQGDPPPNTIAFPLGIQDGHDAWHSVVKGISAPKRSSRKRYQPVETCLINAARWPSGPQARWLLARDDISAVDMVGRAGAPSTGIGVDVRDGGGVLVGVALEMGVAAGVAVWVGALAGAVTS